MTVNFQRRRDYKKNSLVINDQGYRIDTLKFQILLTGHKIGNRNAVIYTPPYATE